MRSRASASRLKALLLENKSLRERAASDEALASRLADLQVWQRERLKATYDDLREQSRYHAALEFFLDDLYGPRDFAARDADLLRVYRLMERMLPARAFETMTCAIELEVLSQQLDLAVVCELAAGAIDESSYAAAYRAANRREDRVHQIDLVIDVGRSLDEIVHRPLIPQLVRLAHAPAHAAGFGALHDFLERGFAAFTAMGSAREFLQAIDRRERLILERLFAGEDAPFALDERERSGPVK